MTLKPVILHLFFFLTFFTFSAQTEINKSIFKKQPINFKGKTGQDTETVRLMDGRLVYKKVTVPKFPKGTDVKLKLTVRSLGDRWDKSGSCFVVTNPEKLSILTVAQGVGKFQADTFVNEKYPGVVNTKNYSPVVELMRFMTPFGVGFYSNDSLKHRRPVYIPSWEKQVVWENDITQLADVLTGEFYVGVWIDSWTTEGYDFDLQLSYSNRPQKKVKIMPLVNTVPYVGEQQLPDNFAHAALQHTITLNKNAKNVKLYYTTTGHGGHSGGDEFIKIKNRIFFDEKLVLDTIPWRDDCASFRRFNPSSGVWIKKDSAAYINHKTRSYQVKEIEERIASSDLSRSNWCPGSFVAPMCIDLGNLNAGTHELKISIPATPVDGDKLNHWLVSCYLTYTE